MAIAVLDIDLEDVPAHFENLESYAQALVLIRYKGFPVGQTYCKLNNGQPQTDDFISLMVNACGEPLWNEWLYDKIGWLERPGVGQPLPRATVAVCTRNRTEDLRRCLDALMELPDDGQEYLVIDNCPSDNSSRDLVATYPGVRYVMESRPGLNIARNRALAESRHSIVAFTDDDAIPDKRWLSSLLLNFHDPMVACVTGLTMPVELETHGQIAFEKYSPFGKGFMRREYNKINRNPLATGIVGAGANMAIRKSITSEIGDFDAALDAGTRTKSGGDHEYFSRILVSGHSIIYDPRALSWHRHRRTFQETKDAIKGYGVGVYAFWTRSLLVEKEFGIIKLAWSWIAKTQLPNVLRCLFLRPGRPHPALVMAELRGCVQGPWAYLASRRHANKYKKSQSNG